MQYISKIPLSPKNCLGSYTHILIAYNIFKIILRNEIYGNSLFLQPIISIYNIYV